MSSTTVLMILYVVFLLGQVAHILKRADLSAASPATAGSTIGEWFKRNIANVVYRVLALSVLFFLWGSPLLDKALNGLGLGAWTGWLPLPSGINPPSIAAALAFGLFGDVLVDWAIAKFAPSLQKELPAETTDQLARLKALNQEVKPEVKAWP